MIWHHKQCILACLIFYTFLVGCWAVEENTHVLNGKATSADNLHDCQAACTNNTRCEGVDWNPTKRAGQKCWLSGPWSGAKRVGKAEGITHYVLNRNCAGKHLWLPRSVHVPVAKRTFLFNQGCRGYEISHPYYPYPYPQILRGYPWIYPYP